MPAHPLLYCLLLDENRRTALESRCQLPLFPNFLEHFIFWATWALNSVLPLGDAALVLGISFSKYGKIGQRASESCVRDGDGVCWKLVGTYPLGLSPSCPLAKIWLSSGRGTKERCVRQSPVEVGYRCGLKARSTGKHLFWEQQPDYKNFLVILLTERPMRQWECFCSSSFLPVS